MLLQLLGLVPGGGAALGLTGAKLAIARRRATSSSAR